MSVNTGQEQNRQTLLKLSVEKQEINELKKKKQFLIVLNVTVKAVM